MRSGFRIIQVRFFSPARCHAFDTSKIFNCSGTNGLRIPEEQWQRFVVDQDGNNTVQLSEHEDDVIKS